MSAEQSNDQQMRCVVQHQYGAADAVLKIEQLPVPLVAPNQVKIAVKAVAINPVDWKIVEGHLANFMPITFPHVPGFDVAGVVVEVGANVNDFEVGDEVYSDTGNAGVGTFAQFCVIDEFRVAKKPQKLSLVEAASVPLVALTSYQALIQAGLLSEDDVEAKQQQQQQQQQQKKLLVLGGSGGCGMFGVMFGKEAGLYVASTCGATNVDRVKQMGCDLVIDYSQQKWFEELKGKDYDVVYDTVGEPEAYEHATKVLKQGGVFISTASRGNALDDFPRKFVLTDTSNGKRQLTHVAKLIDAGKATTYVEKVFKFTDADIHEMFKHSKSGRAKGKLVVLVDESA